MKKFKLLNKLKKMLIVLMCVVTLGFAMPKKSKAGLIGDFIDLLLTIPDGIMHIIDDYMAGSDEFTWIQLEFTGGFDYNASLYNFIISPYDIFTSGTVENGKIKLGLLDTNFFRTESVESDTLVSSEVLAPTIGNIYKALRNLAMILMLIILMYIGLKILLSSVAEQQAKYKQMLIDWLVGFCLLFLMHYIMAFVSNLNELIVNMLANDEGDSYYIGISELEGENADGDDSRSTWFDIIEGLGGTSMSDEKYKIFLSNRLIVRNSTARDGTFSNVGSESGDYSCIDKSGRIDLKEVPMGTHKGYDTPTNSLGYLTYKYSQDYGGPKGVKVDWGNDEVLYLSASLINPGRHDNNEKFENKAIAKLNALSYVRTISSYMLTDADSVVFYQNGKTKRSGKDTKSDVVAAMGYTALYICLVIETIMFLIMYTKRVIQLAFYTMIAPIVAIMYPVDKIGDGKAQAFNTWFKDYLFTSLIQPMHLLLYTVFIFGAAQLMQKNIIYGLVMYGFMISAEKYFKKILGFDKAPSGGPGGFKDAVGRTLAMDSLGKFAGIGPAARRGGSGGGSSDKRRRTKIRTADPATGTPTQPQGGPGGGPTSGGTPTSGGGTSGRHTTRTRNPIAGGSNVPNAGGNKKGFGRVLRGAANTGRAALRLGGRKLVDVTTNGEGVKGLVKNSAKTVAKGFGRAAGLGLGVMAGAATAMTTGDPMNAIKGGFVGYNVGAKWSDGMTNTASEFASAVKDERTKFDQDYANELRERDVKQQFKDDFKDLPNETEEDREEIQALKDTAKKYSHYDDFSDFKEIKALRAVDKEIEDKVPVNNQYKDAIAMEALNSVRKFGDLDNIKNRENFENYLRNRMGTDYSTYGYNNEQEYFDKQMEFAKVVNKKLHKKG